MRFDLRALPTSYDPAMTPDSRLPQLHDARPTARFRSAALVLGLAVSLLAGTALYLVLQERNDVWSAAHRNQQDVALAMQSSITALLDQAVYSLQGIRNDLDALPSTPSRDVELQALREARRFDPLSEYLGLKTSRGLLMVGAHGEAAAPLTASGLPEIDIAAVQADATDEIRFGALLRLQGSNEWYLPVIMTLPRQGDGTASLFSLVPTERLLGATPSLRVLPGSFVTLFTTQGKRLFRKMIAQDELQPNGKPVPLDVRKMIFANRSGSFAAISTVDGRPTVFGYSVSPKLPLGITTGVPESALRDEWLAKSTAPFAVLVAGILAVVVFGVRLRSAIAEQRRYMATQEYLATHDQLTGLPNRYAFIKFVDGVIERAAGVSGRHAGFSVMLLDLNRFKDVNDTLGHAAGDDVLKIFGSRLKLLLSDMPGCVARLGGDELAICATHLDESQADAVARFCGQIHDVLAAPLVIGGVELALTASIGIAAFPLHARTSNELLRCADIAMYRAKADLEPYHHYSELLDHFTPDALAMKADFARAIRDESLTLVYQPKLRTHDLSLVGVEALSRWIHPTRGPISPASFLPLAETTELIHPFTDLVLRNAVKQISLWMAMGFDVPVAVNISANNLLDNTFAGKLRDLLARSAVPARLLELEVTESAVMRYPEVMLKRLHEIRGMGVKMSIDDFGTGYASLSYLKQLPVDTLKIDKLFITNVDSDAGDHRIVKSSILLAHGFDMEVVAEGVETQAVADILLQDGCDFVQGFHFSRPVGRAEIEANWLSKLAPRATEQMDGLPSLVPDGSHH